MTKKEYYQYNKKRSEEIMLEEALKEEEEKEKENYRNFLLEELRFNRLLLDILEMEKDYKEAKYTIYDNIRIIKILKTL